MCECPRCFQHKVEGFSAINRSGQNQEQANAGYFLVLDVLQVKASGLDETRRAEYRLAFIIAVIPMKDTELSVTHSDAAQTQYKIVTLERTTILGNQPERNDFLRNIDRLFVDFDRRRI